MMRMDYDLGTLWENVKIRYDQKGQPVPLRLRAIHRLMQWLLVRLAA